MHGATIPRYENSTGSEARIAMSDASRYCMNCGTPHPGHAKYCVKCGQPLVNELQGEAVAPPHLEAMSAPEARTIPDAGESIPSVKRRENSPFATNLSFRSLQGRTIILGVFAVAWLMQAVRGVLDHLPVALSLAESLGWSLGFSPVIVFLAWLLWQLVFKGEKGRFAFSLAVATAMFSTYVLIAGRNW